MEKLHLDDALEDTPQVNYCIYMHCQASVFSEVSVPCLRCLACSPLCWSAPWLVRPLALSPPGSFAHWLIRPLACLPFGSFAPWLVRPLADSPPGWFFPGFFALSPWTFRPR